MDWFKKYKDHNIWKYKGVGKTGTLFGGDRFVHVYEHIKTKEIRTKNLR